MFAHKLTLGNYSPSLFNHSSVIFVSEKTVFLVNFDHGLGLPVKHFATLIP